MRYVRLLYVFSAVLATAKLADSQGCSGKAVVILSDDKHGMYEGGLFKTFLDELNDPIREAGLPEFWVVFVNTYSDLFARNHQLSARFDARSYTLDSCGFLDVVQGWCKENKCPKGHTGSQVDKGYFCEPSQCALTVAQYGCSTWLPSFQLPTIDVLLNKTMAVASAFSNNQSCEKSEVALSRSIPIQKVDKREGETDKEAMNRFVDEVVVPACTGNGTCPALDKLPGFQVEYIPGPKYRLGNLMRFEENTIATQFINGTGNKAKSLQFICTGDEPKRWDDGPKVCREPPRLMSAAKPEVKGQAKGGDKTQHQRGTTATYSFPKLSAMDSVQFVCVNQTEGWELAELALCTKMTFFVPEPEDGSAEGLANEISHANALSEGKHEFWIVQQQRGSAEDNKGLTLSNGSYTLDISNGTVAVPCDLDRVLEFCSQGGCNVSVGHASTKLSNYAYAKGANNMPAKEALDVLKAFVERYPFPVYLNDVGGNCKRDVGGRWPVVRAQGKSVKAFQQGVLQKCRTATTGLIVLAVFLVILGVGIVVAIVMRKKIKGFLERMSSRGRDKDSPERLELSTAT